MRSISATGQLRVYLSFGLLTAGTIACAHLNTSDMSPKCKTAYNDCLNVCDGMYPAGMGGARDVEIDLSACVESCNRKARICR